MEAKFVSVNVAVRKTLSFRGSQIRTGIFKEPVTGPVRLTVLGLERDFQADHRFHGGPEKALYLYPIEHYAHWEPVLGPQSPGYFGENPTTAGLLETEVCAGDVFRIGSATVAVTEPRSPCFKLGLKVGSPKFVRTFLKSGRLGFY